ncbi:MAG: hypothetical protein QG602_1079 [Verrucomicrobiota bacterium]|nr:hypothetical protein [Verrucomicrobiota bacterium]
MRRPAPPLLLILALLALAGCTTTQTAPAVAEAPAPLPPPPVIELPPASITGSEETSTMLDNFTTFIAAIDGAPVSAGREGWLTPVSLQAGLRRLKVVFVRGVFTGLAELQLNALSEHAYQLRFATDAQFLGNNSYCEFWIVDTATGQPATGRVRAALQRSETAK